jgi:hypothetical protein
LSQSVPEWRPQAACEARASCPPSTNRCRAGDWYGDSQETWGQGPEAEGPEAEDLSDGLGDMPRRRFCVETLYRSFGSLL